MQSIESSSLTQIMGAVTAILKHPSDQSPLAADWLVVPNRDTGRALESELATANGCCVHTTVVTIEKAIWQTLSIDLQALQSQLYWTIAQHLPAHQPTPDESAGEAAWAMTELYLKYLAERPDWLLDWQAGIVPSWLSHQWQARLWQDVRRSIPGEMPHELLVQQLSDPVRLKAATEGIGRIIVVCPNRLSQPLMQWLAAMDTLREVWICLINPGSDGWFFMDDWSTEAPIDRFRQTLCRNRAQTLRALVDLPITSQQLEPPITGTHCLDQIRESLHHSDRLFTCSPDDSLILVDAANPTREVEALKSWIIDRLNQNPDLKLRDVAIVTPDPGLYGPIVQRVFYETDPLDTLPTAPDPLLQQSLHDALLHYCLDCRRDGFSGQRVVDLAHHPAVQSAVGLTEFDCVHITRWLSEAGAIRGHSGHKHSLKAARQRLIFGLLQDPMTTLYRGGIATDTPDQSHRVEWILSVFEATDRILRWPERMPVNAWLEEITQTVRTLSAERIERPEIPIPELMTDMQPWSVIRTWVTNQLSSGLSRPLNLDDRLSVTSPQTAHAVPRRMVALLGANEGTLPQPNEPHPWDLLLENPRTGDPNPVTEALQWVFDLVTQTSDALWISWVGRHASTQQPEDPASAVLALHELLEQGNPSAAWITRLPLAHPINDHQSMPTHSVQVDDAPSATRLEWTLSEFLRTAKDPAAAFLVQQGARLSDHPEEGLDLEPVALSALRRYQLRDELLNAPDGMQPLKTLMTRSGIPEDAVLEEILQDLYPESIQAARSWQRSAARLPDQIMQLPSGMTLQILGQHDAETPRIAQGGTRLHHSMLQVALECLVLCARQTVLKPIEVAIYGGKSQWIHPWDQADALNLLDDWLQLASRSTQMITPVLMGQALQHAYQLNKDSEAPCLIDWNDQFMLHRRHLRRLLQDQPMLNEEHRAIVSRYVCPIERHIRGSNAPI